MCDALESFLERDLLPSSFLSLKLLVTFGTALCDVLEMTNLSGIGNYLETIFTSYVNRKLIPFAQSYVKRKWARKVRAFHRTRAEVSRPMNTGALHSAT